MRIVDCHIHITGEIDPAQLLKQMDANQVERVLLMSQPHRSSLVQTRRNLQQVQKIMAVAPERLTGLARFDNPQLPGVAGLVREALTEMGFCGLKMIPDHWYAYEAHLEPFWELLNELRASVLFHTGILYGNDDGSRFCRPVYLEKLIHYPRIRFAMAHISWPWCDECLAVMGRMRAAVREGNPQWQSYVDLTPGTPRYIRKQALANALEYCGAERLMFGSDSALPGDLTFQRELIQRDSALLDELGVSPEQKQRIFAGTAEELFPVLQKGNA